MSIALWPPKLQRLNARSKREHASILYTGVYYAINTPVHYFLSLSFYMATMLNSALQEAPAPPQSPITPDISRTGEKKEGHYSPYLASRHELERSQSDLEVWGVGLQVIECGSQRLLEVGRALPRRAVRGDLVSSHGGQTNSRELGRSIRCSLVVRLAVPVVVVEIEDA